MIAKTSMVMLPVCFLSGCSYVRVAGFDRQAKTVSISKNHWASMEAVKKEAEKECHSPVTLIRMGNEKAAVRGTDFTYEVYTYSCDS